MNVPTDAEYGAHLRAADAGGLLLPACDCRPRNRTPPSTRPAPARGPAPEAASGTAPRGDRQPPPSLSQPRARDDVRRRRNWHFKWRRPGPAVLARSSQSGSPPPPRRRAAARRPAAAAAAVPRANLGSAARRGGAAVGVARRPGGASLKLGLLHPRAPAWPRTAHVRSRPSKAASSCYLNNTQPWCAPSSQRTRRAPRASGSVPVAHQLAPGRRSAPGPPHLSLRDI